jgi:hypothetical protein
MNISRGLKDMENNHSHSMGEIREISFNRKKTNEVLLPKKIIVFFSGLLLITISTVIQDGYRYNSLALFLSWLISFISLTQILSYNSQPYSLYKIFHIFFLFFLGIAPAQQFKYKVSFWGIQILSDEQYVVGNLLVLSIQILYIFLYRYIIYIKGTKRTNNIPSEQKSSAVGFQQNSLGLSLLNWSTSEYCSSLTSCSISKSSCYGAV